MVTLGSVLLILFAILALVSPIAFVICLARTRRWSADGLVCGGCGYPREGAVSPNCPECGSHISSTSLASSGGGATNGMAVTSMVMGICSLALCIFYGIFTIILAPMGIIFGHIARRQIRNGGYSPSSNGFALTGLICSYIGLGLVLATALMVAILVTL